MSTTQGDESQENKVEDLNHENSQAEQTKTVEEVTEENKGTEVHPSAESIQKEAPSETTPKEESSDPKAPTLLKTETANQEKKPSEKKKSPEQFLKEFNWHIYQEGIEEIEEQKLKEFEALVNSNLVSTNNEDLVEGTVVRITDRDAIIDINSKSEGIISLNEFKYIEDGLKVNDTVDVLIDRREDQTGQMILSHKKARTIRSWDKINSAFKTGEILIGHIKCKTKGGMIVDVLGIETFLPGSQIDVKPIRDYDQYVGKTMEFKVVKINLDYKNIVISHKALIEASIAEQKKEIIGQLKKGQVIEGVVKNMTNYGVFVDLGGVDGLIHITDISWNRISSPSELLELDQTIKVVILDFDEDKSRIQLGLKQLEEHPWDKLDENLKVGDKVKGKVTVIADYGAFVEVADNVEGLVHVSEMSWSTHLRSAQDFVKIGNEIETIILTLDREERRMSLGMKQLTPDPWNDISKKYGIASRHTGVVKNFTNFGIFVELEEGIDGLIYISDLSWTKKIKHPSDFINVGQKIEVVVLELDVEARKLSLGHKQIEENPWDEYEIEYAIGSIHEGKITKNLDKGGIVTFNKDIDAFVPGRFMNREDGTTLAVGDVEKFKIIEFNKDFKKVLASHSSVYREKNISNNKSNNRKTSNDQEKSTLGDIEELANLKKKMKR